jgi:hypothetical protein
MLESISCDLKPFVSNKPFLLYCAGASIRAARACNRHIVALESDSKLFAEVLKPLIAPQPRSAPPETAHITLPDSDDETVPDEPLDCPCE